MTPPFDRREFLKLAGASALATGGVSTGANAQSGESEVIETDLVRVSVPTTAKGSQMFVEELARDGDVHAREIKSALRDQTGDTLDTTEVVGVDRSGNTVEVRRLLETSASTLDSTLIVSVPEGVPGALIDHTVENVGDDTVELNTPGNFIGTDIGLGQAELASPGDAYRFSVQGGDPIAYDEITRWETFDLQGPRGWVTSFDDERAITYGLDGPPSASDPLLAMTGNSPVDKIRLFGTLVTLEPGESATWRTTAVAHDGGPDAPATGGDLVDVAFGDGADQSLVYAGSADGLLYARTVATGDEAWTFEPDGAGSYAMHSSPTVVDGTVYVGTDREEVDGRLYAVDAATGEQEWRSTGLGPGGLLNPSPTVVGGSVYTGGANGLFSIDAETGDPEWQYDEISIEESSPTVVDGTAYVGTEGGELYAVDATTGNVEWQYPVPADDIDSSPTVANGTVYVGTNGGTLHAVDAVTGTQEWEFASPTGRVDSSPTVSDGVVYVAAADATLYAVDTTAGTELWRFGLDGATEATSPTVSEGVIYQATAETLHAVDGSGTEQWRYNDIAGPSSSPTVHGGTVFVGSGESDNQNDGVIVALDAETGDVKWTTDDPTLFVISSPTVVTDPESGRSVDSRVALRTLGHHGPDDGGGQSATVSGTVRDAGSGDPLPGVTVRFTRGDTGQEFTVETAGTQESAPGEYSIALPVDGATDYQIEVDPDGYQGFTDDITLSPDDTVTREIELTALSGGSATVSGFVRDASTEEPLIGVTVRFTRADTGQEFTVETTDGVGGDAPGKYSIDLPVAGATDYELVVDPDGYQRFTDTITLSPGDSVPKTIILSRTIATVVGSVRDAQNNPLGGVTVGFTRTNTGEEFTVETAEGSQMTGEYSIDLPVAGETEYGITVDLEEYQRFTDDITLSPGDSQSETIILSEADQNPDPTGTVSGQVTDTLGPLSDVTLEFVPNGADTPAETTATDDSGNYEVELPVGNYVITALATAYEPTEVPASVEEDTTSTVDIELTATNPPVTISNFEVGPDNLLSGVDAAISFFVGVETDDGADVEVDQVDVLYRDSEFSAQQITDVDPDALELPLIRVGVVPSPFNSPVQSAENLLDLPAEQIYLVDVPQGPTPLKNGDNLFRMRVTASDGSAYAEEVHIPQFRQGDKLASFNTTAIGPNVNFDQNFFDFDHEINFGEGKMPDNLPVNIGIPLFDADLDYTGRGSLDLNTLAATAASRSAGGVSVLGTAGIEFQAGGRWDGVVNDFNYNLNLADLWLAGLAQTPVPLPKKFKVWTPKLPVVGKQKFEIGLNVLPGGYLLLGNSDPSTPGTATATSVSQDSGTEDRRALQPRSVEFPVPENREFNAYFTVEGTATAGNVEPFISGSMHGANDITLAGVMTPPIGLLPLEPRGGEICLDGGITVSALGVSKTISIETLVDLTPGFDDPCVQIDEVREPPCWEVFGIDGDCQEYPSPSSSSPSASGYAISASDVELAATTGRNPPADAITAGTETAVLTRLTDRAEIDSTPAVAARAGANEHLAVWERHPEDTPAEDGRTLVTATRDNSGWSDPTTLADTTASGTSYHEPALAIDAGTAAIAWTRYSLGESGEVRAFDEATQIEVVVEDGAGWSDPVVVAETDDWVDRNPAIAPLGDGWVVAWERAKVDSDTRAVGYAVLDASRTVQRSETIMKATQLGITQLGVGIDGGSVVLGYHDRATQQVRRDLITASDRTRDQTYDLAAGLSVRDLSVAGQDTAWLATDEETTTGFYAAGTSVEELSFVSRESSLSRLDLVETATGPVLTAARVPEDDVRERSFVYRLRDGDTWRPEQTPASTDATENVKLMGSAVAPTTDGDGLMSLIETKVHDPEAVSDIVAVEQPLRPSYAITAEADQETVPPGEEVTISYTVENTGDLDGDAIGDNPVPVEARSQGETLAAQTVAPLARGATASGSLTVTVDETGTVEVVVGRNLDLLDPAERRTTVEAATPGLAVESVTVERPAEETAVATIRVRNGGLAAADDVSVEVTAGDGTVLGTPTAPGLAAGERTAVTVEYDPANLIDARGEQIRLDPAGSLPDSNVTERVSSVLLGQPDIEVGDTISYRSTRNGVTAELDLTNAGPVSTEASVRVVQADATPTEDIFATETTTLPAAIGGAPRTTSLSLALGDINYGTEIRFVVESNRPDAGAGIPVVYDRVGSFERPPTLPGQASPPQDLNDDGLYEDVDGDGDFDVRDVQVLFENLDSTPVQSSPDAFSFAGGSGVGFADVEALLEDLRAATGEQIPHAAIFADENGVVTTAGLQAGIDRWQSGQIETGQLQGLIDAWQSGEPVVDSG